MAGCKQIAKGIKENSTLESLNIKGNMIGDDGIILLSESLRDANRL